MEDIPGDITVYRRVWFTVITPEQNVEEREELDGNPTRSVLSSKTQAHTQEGQKSPIYH